MINHLRGLPGLSFDDLTAQLAPLYGPCCEAHASPPAKISPEIQQLLDEIVEYLYEMKGLGHPLHPALIRHYAERYWAGVQEGYGKNLAQLPADADDFQMLEALQKNVWQFSGAKTYSQLRALNNALIGDDGKLLTLSAFRKAASAINSDYIGPWLDTEYHTAVGGAQMAAKWTRWKSDGQTLLEFDAVMDNRTTQTCRELNGVVKPITDPFWSIYYPPNHFLCRSTVRGLYSGAITPDANIQHPDIPDMFRTNLAEKGLVFPAGHPYYEGLPGQVSQEAEKLRSNDKRSGTSAGK